MAELRPRWAWPAALRRLAVFALLWWAITEGDPSTWLYAVLIVPVATATSMLLVPYRPAASGPGWGRRTWALVRLAAWFLRRSMAGGIDVSRRALRRHVDLTPGFVHCPLRLPFGAGRIAVADLMNLMPGSLSVILTEDGLTLHVLDTQMPIPQTVADLEERIARVTGQVLG